MKTYDRYFSGRLRCTESISVGTLDMFRVDRRRLDDGGVFVQSELFKGFVFYEG